MAAVVGKESRELRRKQRAEAASAKRAVAAEEAAARLKRIRNARVRLALRVSVVAAGVIVLFGGVVIWGVPALAQNSYSGASSQLVLQPAHPEEYYSAYGDILDAQVRDDAAADPLGNSPYIRVSQMFSLPQAASVEGSEVPDKYGWKISLASGITQYRLWTPDKSKPLRFVWGNWIDVPAAKRSESIAIPAIAVPAPAGKTNGVLVGVEARINPPVVSAGLSGDGVWTKYWEFSYVPGDPVVQWHLVQTQGVNDWPQVPNPAALVPYKGNATIQISFCPKCGIVHGHSGLEEIAPNTYALLAATTVPKSFAVDAIWRPYGWFSPFLFQVVIPGVVPTILVAAAVLWWKQLLLLLGVKSRAEATRVEVSG